MKASKRRKELFSYLDGVLRKSEKIFKKNHSKRQVQLQFGRLLVQAIVAYGKLLETDEHELRILKLEEQIKDGVVIPREKH